MTALSRREQNRMTRRGQILDAALQVFAEQGFSGASMEAVARASGLTKPTLYQYFPTKEVLFAAVLAARRDTMLLAIDRADPDRMVAQIHTFAWRYAETVLRPDLLALARLIVGEAQRFPDIGRAYQSGGPDQLLQGMMEYLEAQRGFGRLRFEDAELAAQDLWGMILSAPRNRALHDPDWTPDRATLARYVDHGLRNFLRLYSTRADQDLTRLQDLT